MSFMYIYFSKMTFVSFCVLEQVGKLSSTTLRHSDITNATNLKFSHMYILYEVIRKVITF